MTVVVMQIKNYGQKRKLPATGTLYLNPVSNRIEVFGNPTLAEEYITKNYTNIREYTDVKGPRIKIVYECETKNEEYCRIETFDKLVKEAV